MTESDQRPFTQDSRELFAALVTDGSDAIAVVTADRDGSPSEIVYVNDAWCAEIGQARAALLGGPSRWLVGTRSDARWMDTLHATGADDLPPTRARRVRDDGALTDIERRVVPLRDAKGQVTHFAIVERNVTAEECARRRAESERLSADRITVASQVTIGAAYELENPLSTVLAHLDYAAASLATHADEGVRCAIAQARDAAARAREVVRDLRALSPRESVNAEPIDVHTALGLAMGITAHALADRAAVCTSYAPLPPVRANLGRLAQVFAQVLFNAAQSFPVTAPAHNRVRIETSVSVNGSAVIAIADTGEGIEPLDLPHVFDPFFTSKPRPVSTGLGLSIARATVRALGGDIVIESQIGLGTQVRIVLPAAGPVALSAPETRADNLPRRSVLVVATDPLDYPRLRTLLASDLASLTFASPSEALERLLFGDTYDSIVYDAATRSEDGARFRDQLALTAPDASRSALELSFGVVDVLDDRRIHDSGPFLIAQDRAESRGAARRRK